MKSGMDLAGSTRVNNGESLQGYNPILDFSKLQAGQPICYSEGKVPNFKHCKNSDGSCSSISAKYHPLLINDIESYNKIWVERIQ